MMLLLTGIYDVVPITLPTGEITEPTVEIVLTGEMTLPTVVIDPPVDTDVYEGV
jgi:hypothetical protein